MCGASSPGPTETGWGWAAEYPLLGGVYQETQPTRYRITQPRDKRKSGFLSQDASKRDVCMNMTMNTIQNQVLFPQHSPQTFWHSPRHPPTPPSNFNRAISCVGVTTMCGG